MEEAEGDKMSWKKHSKPEIKLAGKSQLSRHEMIMINSPQWRGNKGNDFWKSLKGNLDEA